MLNGVYFHTVWANTANLYSLLLLKKPEHLQVQ